MWEILLQEVEVDSALVAQVANCLSGRRSGCGGGGGGGGIGGGGIGGPGGNSQMSQLANDHRKMEARKIFQHRQLLESALDKAAQQLEKVKCTFIRSFIRSFVDSLIRSFVWDEEKGGGGGGK